MAVMYPSTSAPTVQIGGSGFHLAFHLFWRCSSRTRPVISAFNRFELVFSWDKTFATSVSWASISGPAAMYVFSRSSFEDSPNRVALKPTATSRTILSIRVIELFPFCCLSFTRSIWIVGKQVLIDGRRPPIGRSLAFVRWHECPHECSKQRLPEASSPQVGPAAAERLLGISCNHDALSCVTGRLVILERPAEQVRLFPGNNDLRSGGICRHDHLVSVWKNTNFVSLTLHSLP